MQYNLLNFDIVGKFIMKLLENVGKKRRRNY